MGSAGEEPTYEARDEHEREHGKLSRCHGAPRAAGAHDHQRQGRPIQQRRRRRRDGPPERPARATPPPVKPVCLDGGDTGPAGYLCCPIRSRGARLPRRTGCTRIDDSSMRRRPVSAPQLPASRERAPATPRAQIRRRQRLLPLAPRKLVFQLLQRRQQVLLGDGRELQQLGRTTTATKLASTAKTLDCKTPKGQITAACALATRPGLEHG
jgi:hypothetical protein